MASNRRTVQVIKSRASYRKNEKVRSNNIWIWICGIALVGITVFSLWWNASSPKTVIEVTGAPRLKVDKDKVDLGNISLGQTVFVSFTLSNVGDKPLQITDDPYIEVVKGCCPPKPEIGARILQPGETTKVTVQFLMHGNMGGYHDFRLHIATNDPSQKDRTMTIISNWV